jgi:hypothetical protein
VWHLIVPSLYVTIYTVLVSALEYLLIDICLHIYYFELFFVSLSEVFQRLLNVTIEVLHSDDCIDFSEVVTQF